VEEEAKERPSSNRRGIASRRDSNPQERGNNTSMLVPPTAVVMAVSVDGYSMIGAGEVACSGSSRQWSVCSVAASAQSYR